MPDAGFVFHPLPATAPGREFGRHDRRVGSEEGDRPALSACEPKAVANLPTRTEIAAARVSAADVFDKQARAVEFETGASETSTFSGGDTGRAVVDVSWTVSFEPVTG